MLKWLQRLRLVLIFSCLMVDKIFGKKRSKSSYNQNTIEIKSK